MRICGNAHDGKVAGASRARPLRRHLASRILTPGETLQPPGSADVLDGTANEKANEKAVSDTLLTLHSLANGCLRVRETTASGKDRGKARPIQSPPMLVSRDLAMLLSGLDY